MHCFTTLASPPFCCCCWCCALQSWEFTYLEFFFLFTSFGAHIFFWFLDFSLEFSDLFVVVALELLVPLLLL